MLIVKRDIMRTNLMSSMRALLRSDVVSDWLPAASFSLESDISDCCSSSPPSASLLTPDISPLGREANSYISSSSSSSTTRSSSPLTRGQHWADTKWKKGIENNFLFREHFLSLEPKLSICNHLVGCSGWEWRRRSCCPLRCPLDTHLHSYSELTDCRSQNLSNYTEDKAKSN